jgi:hypothetical protein
MIQPISALKSAKVYLQVNLEKVRPPRPLSRLAPGSKVTPLSPLSGRLSKSPPCDFDQGARGGTLIAALPPGGRPNDEVDVLAVVGVGDQQLADASQHPGLFRGVGSVRKRYPLAASARRSRCLFRDKRSASRSGTAAVVRPWRRLRGRGPKWKHSGHSSTPQRLCSPPPTMVDGLGDRCARPAENPTNTPIIGQWRRTPDPTHC